MNEAKKYFLENLDEGYQIRSGENYPELVTPDFYQKLGEYIFLNFEQKDTLKITGTLENLNKRQLNKVVGLFLCILILKS